MEVTIERDLEKDYGPMVRSIARKFPVISSRFDFEDLYAEGMKAVIVGVRDRPTDTPYKESTWVYNAIQMAILSYVRKNSYDLSVSEHTQRKANKEGVKDVLNRQARAIRADQSKDSNSGRDEENPSMLSTIASGEPPVHEKMIQAEQLEILRDEISSLSEREQNVLTAFFIRGDKLRDIAEAEGVTAQRVAQIKDRAFGKLQEGMKKRYADAIA
jgi:RNA polymerase sigma factor (sigma-70 family)